MRITDALTNKLKRLPSKPGVYKFFDNEGKLIYVGKAKSLKSRVNNYFQSTSEHNYKTKRLVSLIHDLEFTIVNSEFDAMLLENSLIKENQPKYNIQLKDDKSFPYICILDEPFPRIISTRRFKKENGKYFGPYSNVKALNTVLNLIRKLYTIRTCSLNLEDKNIDLKKFKVCLEYHIGNCLGPCERLQNVEDYAKNIEQAEHILKGNIHLCVKYFKEQMKVYSDNYEFEKAQAIKDKLLKLEKFQSRTQIVNPQLNDIDVFTITSDEKSKAYINYLQISNGSIIVAENIIAQRKLEEDDDEVLTHAIIEFRNRYESRARDILTNISVQLNEEIVSTVPKIGDKKKLVELSLKNAIQYKHDKKAIIETKETNKDFVITQLQEDLQLTQLPRHIECFDNSNIQGTNPVASMVCFIDGKPAKKEYRHFNIKTVIGPDDFSSMREIVFRRYSRLLKENKPLPNLIIVDGGKGQLSSACNALQELNIYGKVPIVGIAKQLEEIYFPRDSEPLYINRKSPSLKLIQHLRNEAHRFAITFHRNQRSKDLHQTSLKAIKGIGPETEKLLLRKFKTIKKIQETSIEDLANVIGLQKAKLIQEHLKTKKP